MKQNRLHTFIRFFSYSFFVFLAGFTFVKFIFIFFFHAAFSPMFLFHLTPLHLIGLDKLQLLLISLVVVIINAYLHIYDTRKNLSISLLFTSFILLGLGGTIATHPFSTIYLSHYVLFSFLLIILPFDHRRTLPIKEATPTPKHTTTTPSFVDALRNKFNTILPDKNTVTSSPTQPASSAPNEELNSFSPLTDNDIRSLESLAMPYREILIDAGIETIDTLAQYSPTKLFNTVLVDYLLNNKIIDHVEINADGQTLVITEELIDQWMQTLDSLQSLDSHYQEMLSEVDIEAIDDLTDYTSFDLFAVLVKKVMLDYNAIDQLEISDDKGNIFLDEDMISQWIDLAKEHTSPHQNNDFQSQRDDSSD